jgi:hypothetical protein
MGMLLASAPLLKSPARVFFYVPAFDPSPTGKIIFIFNIFVISSKIKASILLAKLTSW